MSQSRALSELQVSDGILAGPLRKIEAQANQGYPPLVQKLAQARKEDFLISKYYLKAERRVSPSRC